MGKYLEKKSVEVNFLKVFNHIQAPLFLDCNLSCKHANSKESFPESKIQLKFSDTRKSSDIFDSRFRVLVPSLLINTNTDIVLKVSFKLSALEFR